MDNSELMKVLLDIQTSNEEIKGAILELTRRLGAIHARLEGFEARIPGFFSQVQGRFDELTPHLKRD